MSVSEGKSDRELLALVAKAIELEIEFPITRSGDPYPCRKSDMLPWNPLTDDGDALRLSATLRISINQDEPIQVGFLEGIGGEYEAGVEAWKVLGPEDVIEARVIYGSDPNAATRRAIVLAAAEFGSRK